MNWSWLAFWKPAQQKEGERILNEGNFEWTSWSINGRCCEHCHRSMASIWSKHHRQTTNPLGEVFTHNFTVYEGDACTYCQYMVKNTEGWRQWDGWGHEPILLKDFVAKHKETQ